MAGTVEFERFRPLLTKGLGYSDGARGGRPPFDPVAMFKVLVVQAQHNLSDARVQLALPSDLTDAEWIVLELFFPPPPYVGRPRK